MSQRFNDAVLRRLRRRFDPGLVTTATAMEAHVPTGGAQVRRGLRYGDHPRSTFDLVPANREGPAPTVVWVHGGGWFFGDKANVVPYLEILASHGYAGVALNYPLAPEDRYPRGLHELDRALAHLREHAAGLGLDRDRFVLAGDSVGAQLVSQLAVAASVPEYAESLGLVASLRPPELRGVVLCCGVFDLPALRQCSGSFGRIMRRVARAYAGEPRWASSVTAAEASVVRHVTADFPPTFLSAGSHDPLSPGQARPFAERLTALGLDPDTVFVGDEAEPAYHEFQFLLDTAAAQLVLSRLLGFLDRVSVPTC